MESIFDDVWDAILAKDPASRTPREWTIFRGAVLLDDIQSGGFFYNVSPAEGEAQNSWRELRATSTALLELGCAKEAALLTLAAERFERAAEVPRTTWGDFVKVAGPDGWLKEIEAELESACKRLEQALASYRRTHFVHSET